MYFLSFKLNLRLSNKVDWKNVGAPTVVMQRLAWLWRVGEIAKINYFMLLCG